MDQKIASLGPESRLKNPALGAGSLLDIGIYSLTWGIVGSEPPLGGAEGLKKAPETPKVLAAQTLSDGIDVGMSAIFLYADGCQSIVTSNTSVKSAPEFCRVEGSEGTVVVEGVAASVPGSFTVKKLNGEEKKYDFERPGMGFYWEADAVALDIAAGRTESAIMPWAETLRVMQLMDEIRRQGGARFPQDDQ
ncbi:D-xylose 1-dehydrogenase (NADP(+)) like protein [Verticillium longisporum]|nr:D-xylose 1-dehydrogenase (NADP(+)) like protein [Verticillium longisporum]